MSRDNVSSIRLRLVSPLLMWAIVIPGIVILFRALPDHTLFHRSWLAVAGFVLTLGNWLYFFISASIVNKWARRSAAGVERIVTTGVYSKVRHPIYSADIFLAWGVFLLFPTLKVLCSVVWLTIVLIVWMKLEEAALLQRFGDEYAQYKFRTPMMIPNYFHRG